LPTKKVTRIATTQNFSDHGPIGGCCCITGLEIFLQTSSLVYKRWIFVSGFLL